MRRLGWWARIALLAAALTLAATTCAAEPERISGRAVEVRSGDTLVVDDGSRQIEVRLADIGAPRDAEYHAPVSRSRLASLVKERSLSVVVAGRTPDSTVFGHVSAGKLDVNLEMVRQGAAWVCWDFASRTDYLPFENEAKRQRRGLWSGTWEVNVLARCRERPPAGARTSGPGPSNLAVLRS